MGTWRLQIDGPRYRAYRLEHESIDASVYAAASGADGCYGPWSLLVARRDSLRGQRRLSGYQTPETAQREAEAIVKKMERKR